MGGVNKGGKRKGKEGKPKERDEKNENCGGREEEGEKSLEITKEE